MSYEGGGGIGACCEGFGGKDIIGITGCGMSCTGSF